MNGYIIENEIIASCQPRYGMLREMEQPVGNRKYQRIRKACFPQMKYLQELGLEELPSVGRIFLPEFETLSFSNMRGNNLENATVSRV